VKFLLDHDVPDDLSYLLEQLGHDVTFLRKALPRDSSDEAVFQFAHGAGCILPTCNRDDFLHLAATQPHHGIIIIVRRRTRAEERVARFGCSTALARRASEITSTSPDRRESDPRAVSGYAAAIHFPERDLGLACLHFRESRVSRQLDAEHPNFWMARNTASRAGDLQSGGPCA
jgi:predicted nuclease of predicted toxin-antitoxin system